MKLKHLVCALCTVLVATGLSACGNKGQLKTPTQIEIDAEKKARRQEKRARERQQELEKQQQTEGAVSAPFTPAQ